MSLSGWTDRLRPALTIAAVLVIAVSVGSIHMGPPRAAWSAEQLVGVYSQGVDGLVFARDGDGGAWIQMSSDDWSLEGAWFHQPMSGPVSLVRIVFDEYRVIYEFSPANNRRLKMLRMVGMDGRDHTPPNPLDFLRIGNFAPRGSG